MEVSSGSLWRELTVFCVQEGVDIHTDRICTSYHVGAQRPRGFTEIEVQKINRASCWEAQSILEYRADQTISQAYFLRGDTHELDHSYSCGSFFCRSHLELDFNYSYRPFSWGAPIRTRFQFFLHCTIRLLRHLAITFLHNKIFGADPMLQGFGCHGRDVSFAHHTTDNVCTTTLTHFSLFVCILFNSG